MSSIRFSWLTIGFVLFAILAVAILLLSSVQLAGARAAVPEPPAQKQEPKNQPGKPLDVKGQLQGNDANDPARNQPCKTYTVKLKKDRTYVIDMASVDFDTYLRLEDSQGKQLAEDDDSGGGVNMLDAQIAFTPEKDDTFKIVATRFDEGTGNFALTVRELAYKTGKAQTLKDGQLKIESKLTNDDPQDMLGPKNRCNVYTVKMVAKRTYTIDLVSTDFDAFLRLTDGQFKKLAEDDDGGGDLNSRIVFMPKTDGDYHIIATSLDGQLGSYTLSVREEK
jgi:hypothetical protein